MLPDSLKTLHPDFEVAEKLEERLAKNFAGTHAREALLRCVDASEKHMGEQVAKQRRIEHFSSVSRDLHHVITDFEREERHGAVINAHRREEYGKAKKQRAKLQGDIAVIRNVPVAPNLPPETLWDFILSESNASVRFVDAPVKMSGPLTREALEESRGKLKELAHRKHEIRNAPVSKALAIQRLVEDTRRRAVAPDFSGVTRLRASDQFYRADRAPDVQGHVEFPSRSIYLDGNSHEFDLGVGLLCWLHGDSIIERGTAAIETFYQGRKAFAPEERERLIKEIDAEYLEEERREEMLIRALESSGQTLWRRPAADPLAVLGIRPA